MTEANETEVQAPEMVESLEELKPINLKYKKFSRGRKRKKYSKGTGDWQRMEADISKINKKVAKAIAEGASTYERERSNSASNKKDGAVKDFRRNLAEAISTSLDETTDVPKDIANMMDTKTSRKLLKRQLKMMSNPMKVFRS